MKTNKVKEAWGEFPYKENYYALLACILTEDSSSKCIRDICCMSPNDGVETEYEPTLSEEERNKFRIYNKSEKSTISKKIKVKVINIINGDIEIYDNKTQAENDLGISKDLLNYYIRNKKVYKKKYKIVTMDQRNIDYSVKKVNVYDAVEDKLTKYESQKQVCEALGCVHKTIKAYNGTGKLFRNRYKIDIVKENN